MQLIPAHFDWHTFPVATKAYHPVIGIVCYLTVIFTLRRLMRDRDPIKMRYIKFFHNVFLCLLSFAMALGILVEVFRVLLLRGGTADGSGLIDGLSSAAAGTASIGKEQLQQTLMTPMTAVREVLCDSQGHLMTGRMAWWMYIFYLSKYYEFVDTVIMVLTKRPLNFLHVYHHCIVLPLFYVYMSTHMVLQWIIVVANCLVHVAMYYYYAMAGMGHKVWWKKYITMAQIVQFIIDLTSTWPYPFLYFSSKGCSGSMRAWLFGQAVGFSFFKLFTDFYTRSYNKSKAQKQQQQQQQQQQQGTTKPTEKTNNDPSNKDKSSSTHEKSS